MAELLTRIPTNLTEYPNSFKRQGCFPLEAYSVFYAIIDTDGTVVASALDAAKDYAKNNPIAYVGQILSVVDEDTKTVSTYIISNTDGDLEPIGGDFATKDFVEEAIDEAVENIDISNKKGVIVSITNDNVLKLESETIKVEIENNVLKLI